MAHTMLDRERHIKYWKRCHSTFLPSPYTSNDSIRLTLACFIVSSLDLLQSPLSKEERLAIRKWVFSLQHPDGGFCGSSTHSQQQQGTANLAAAFFALVLLGLAAGEDLEEQKAAFAGVKRKQLLKWLKKLQRPDGGFGQLIWEGESVGGTDMRHCYMAAGIRWMLRGNVTKGDASWVEDIDVDKLREYINHSKTYDGGLGESSSKHESHGGYTYCGISTLAFLDDIGAADGKPTGPSKSSLGDRKDLLRFLALRQFAYLASEEEEDDGETENRIERQLQDLKIGQHETHVGFNGRWNKKADTCYCWWAGGALQLLDKLPFVVNAPSRNYLLDITQHRIGGFSKTVGGPPDIYHSYLGLAALAVLGEEQLKEFDARLCCSLDTTRAIIAARDGLLAADKLRSQWDDGFWGN